MTYVTGRYKIFGEGLQVYGDLLMPRRSRTTALRRPLRFQWSGRSRRQPLQSLPRSTMIRTTTYPEAAPLSLSHD